MRTLVALMTVAALHASATTWEVGPRPHGEVRFTVEGPLDDVPGITREVSGSFELDVKNVAQVKGNVAVPLDSVKTGIDQRDDDMRVQFLETAKFPNAVLTIDRLERASSATLSPGQEVQGEAIGSFELHGKRRAVRAPVTLKLDDLNRLWVAGSLEVPFSDYGIARPARLFLKLGETADVRFKVLFVPRAEQAEAAVAQAVAPTVTEVLPEAPKAKPRPKKKAPKALTVAKKFARSPDERVRRGEQLFFTPLPGRESTLTCGHCHSTVDERQGHTQSDGYVRPASTVWNSAQRPDFWGGLAKTPGGAADVCTRKYVDDQGLKPEERAALDAYLRALSPDPQPDYYYSGLYRTIESPVANLLGGDAKQGEKKMKLHCGACHDDARAAPKLQRALYEPEWIVRRVRWMEGHESHACPPQRMTRLNDTELRDIVTFLAGPGAGDRIFQRSR